MTSAAYIRHNVRTNTWSVYAWVFPITPKEISHELTYYNNQLPLPQAPQTLPRKRTVVARVKHETDAIRIRNKWNEE